MDAELETFKREIDLRQYAAHQGYELDRKESWAGSAVMRHPNNDKIIIKRAADSHWIYCSVRDDNDNGTVIDFAKRRLNLSLGAVRKELRQFMGLPASALPSYPPLPKAARDRLRVERNWSRMQTAVHHPYLEDELAIPRAMLESRRFVGRIRIDARGHAAFGHFDADGLCGFELKNTGYTSFVAGGSKGLWSSHVQDTDTRLIFCESAIDGLSHAALYPDENDRSASIGGRPTSLQRELMRSAAAAMSQQSTVVAAMDADAGGRELAEMVRAALVLTGRTDLRFEIQEPEGGIKDFNDVIRRRRLTGSRRIPSPSLPRIRPATSSAHSTPKE
jgi:hypothetical protein